ncbi:uncharacterized protein EI90DRAFT_2904255 [Cantharellus anzutake]|uniref:uncharacterized protein n=1 Tax=Cantharellus anzutake TaxID=1750568 RepID=UPI0019056E08|nr:uncharacterized protein EI90DRAFT_2904255 [Cantharellus anzutake]KAF8342082.1 hypothetical protein EI90DRAFT_2904255 [Cantharellus anzutake]
MVKWLSTTGISKGAINGFLNLKYVCSSFVFNKITYHSQTEQVQKRPFSFRSADTMYGKVRSMPGAPGWHQETITMDDAPLEPQEWMRRNPVECLEFLFQNPSFNGEMDFGPYKVFTADGDIRVYHEMATGDDWHEQQAHLPDGTTILSMMLASDKTHLTNFTGDQRMHPLYISLGNIHKDVHRKINRHAWMLLAKLPVCKFAQTTFNTSGGTLEEAARMPGIVQQEMFHHCLEITLAPLLTVQQVPRLMTGPDGLVRACVAILMSHLADLEEQQMVAITQTGNCSVCLVPHHAQEEYTEHPARTRDWILDPLKRLREQYPHASTFEFSQEAKRLKLGLSGCTESPYWKGFKQCPSHFVSQDLLHGCYKFFWDHVVSWLTSTLGEAELDRRLIAQPPDNRAPHFPNGLSCISQASGREFKAFQSIAVVVIAGHDAVTPAIMKAVRSLLDYIFIAQSPIISKIDLQLMKRSLECFHRYKRAFIQNGSREQGHMNIPKLHALPHFMDDTCRKGTPDNFSTETPETQHIKICKEPYCMSNKRDYAQQIVNFLDVQEKIALRML